MCCRKASHHQWHFIYVFIFLIVTWFSKLDSSDLKIPVSESGSTILRRWPPPIESRVPEDVCSFLSSRDNDNIFGCASSCERKNFFRYVAFLKTFFQLPFDCNLFLFYIIKSQIRCQKASHHQYCFILFFIVTWFSRLDSSDLKIVVPALESTIPRRCPPPIESRVSNDEYFCLSSRGNENMFR